MSRDGKIKQTYQLERCYFYLHRIHCHFCQITDRRVGTKAYLRLIHTTYEITYTCDSSSAEWRSESRSRKYLKIRWPCLKNVWKSDRTIGVWDVCHPFIWLAPIVVDLRLSGCHYSHIHISWDPRQAKSFITGTKSATEVRPCNNKKL